MRIMCAWAFSDWKRSVEQKLKRNNERKKNKKNAEEDVNIQNESIVSMKNIYEKKVFCIEINVYCELII